VIHVQQRRDVDEQGRPLPMTVEVLQARTEKWPVSPHTPESVAAQLARSRQLFVDGYYAYENFIDAATRSLQGFDAGSKISFARLIDRARAEGFINDDAQEILHVARELRNRQIYATTLAGFTRRSPPGSSGRPTSLSSSCSGSESSAAQG
jgi:hypothetical protein